MISKYNEEEYAKEVEKRGFLSNRHNYELTLLVKLWKHQGVKPQQRKEMLYKFCNRHIENFNDIKYFRQLNSILRNGQKKTNPLIIVESISITDNEIMYINGLEIEYDYKKILFSLLVHLKLKKEVVRLKYGNVPKYNYLGGHQKFYNEICEVAKLSQRYKINNVINDLANLGFVDVRTAGKIKLLFIDHILLSDKIIFNITTYDNLGYYFDWFNGDKKIIRCENCGKLLKQTSNNKKYCRYCAKYKKNQQNLQWWHHNTRKVE